MRKTDEKYHVWSRRPIIWLLVHSFPEAIKRIHVKLSEWTSTKIFHCIACSERKEYNTLNHFRSCILSHKNFQNFSNLLVLDMRLACNLKKNKKNWRSFVRYAYRVYQTLGSGVVNLLSFNASYTVGRITLEIAACIHSPISQMLFFTYIHHFLWCQRFPSFSENLCATGLT